MSRDAPSTASPEVHIAGVLVHTRQPGSLAIAASIDALPEAEVQQVSPEGRIVVVLEAGSARQIMDTVDAVRAIPGVLNVALVYQHAEPAAAMREEIGT